MEEESNGVGVINEKHPFAGYDKAGPNSIYISLLLLSSSLVPLILSLSLTLSLFLSRELPRSISLVPIPILPPQLPCIQIKGDKSWLV